MDYFVAGFLTCAAISVLFPRAFQRIHDAAARAIEWLRGLAKQGPAE